MTRAIKNFLGHLTFGTHLDAILLGNAAVIVAFHRVGDAPDPRGLTVTGDMFQRFCTFFSEHFNVTTLRGLVEKLESGRGVDRDLVITFDDGYRDNFENAAPVLDRLSLPATFFVVSQWIDSAVVPWWDQDDAVRHPWMTWAQVQYLHQHGFEIGGHTRTHADLGQVSAAVAIEEVLGSKLELEHRLSSRLDSFAYPYGRRENLAPINREVVKAAGFRCCCSCYGGINAQQSDPFHLARIPMSPWFLTPHQFGMEVAFGLSVLPC